MDLRGDFSELQVNELTNLLKKKTTVEGGHHIFSVMNSRKGRVSADVVYRKKFYPVWAVLERLGRVQEIRPEGDVLLVPTCGHKQCVNPEHMEWVSRGAYRASFQKSMFEHSLTGWTDEKLAILKTLVEAKTPQTKISKILGFSQSTISRACKELEI